MEPTWAKTLLLTGGVLLVPVFALVTSVVFWPGVLLKAYNWCNRRLQGMAVRYSHSGSYRFCYSTRGTPGGATPSLLLLHGFAASKDMWLPVVMYLPRNLHVVCLDMPGHEGTSRTGAEDYSIQGQARRVHQFVRSVGLDKSPFHLVGTSMGGNVAGVYAGLYPADVCSLTLVCPAGLVYPTESSFIALLKELDLEKPIAPSKPIPLIPTSMQELEAMLKLCCYKSPKIPRQFLRGLLANRIPNNNFYREVFLEIVGEKSRHSLQQHLNLITAPLQVIWGKNDQILDVSGAAVIQKALPHCQVDLLDNCGHAIALERPRKFANLVLDFHNKAKKQA
ncbi:monoacylglycerol lipase abhd6-A-like [Xiphophorus couchianus]|uniref:monoacylglycerol lipase abhd6-A-like n=1 Tax=Xiphophorus couchianus TaxID=32473 RepID=UPI0010165BB9|nr:monoacylglycerol lipase abhd6-A-like [Xiphophorus couchianus]XP_027859652.1 monoacylglycerol lipase abhd6-A-like [Xiphophorus couchianus]XP_027859653.1 monoacylglycerol lipase abhd6-A-like [Xiphophorus couchianus]